MFSALREHLARPPLFSVYSADKLWTDDHVSSQMLQHHLDPSSDVASRNHDFIRRAGHWMVDQFGLIERPVLDLGCGPGLYAHELARLGAKVMGLDFSRRSIEFAKARAQEESLSATFEVADYRTYDTDKSFDLICLVYGDYGVLAPEQRRRLLQRAQQWLEPGGVIVLDVFGALHLSSVREASTIEAHLGGGFWSPNPHFVLTTRFRYEDAGAYLDRFLVVEEERQWEVFNWLQCFDRERLQAELTEVGLEVSAWLGSVAGDPFDTESPEFAVVARKLGKEST
jgi:SAM-dependent methyltransferase